VILVLSGIEEMEAVHQEEKVVLQEGTFLQILELLALTAIDQQLIAPNIVTNVSKIVNIADSLISESH
jgi:hypothetical protein